MSHPAEFELPLAERIASKVVSRTLLWLGKRAHDRGDTHAYGHALSALRAGDCAHSGCPTPCVDCGKAIAGGNGSEDDHRCWECVIPPAMTETTPTPAAPSRRAEVNGEGE